jgi:hypothetical protein
MTEKKSKKKTEQKNKNKRIRTIKQNLKIFQNVKNNLEKKYD